MFVVRVSVRSAANKLNILIPDTMRNLLYATALDQVSVKTITSDNVNVLLKLLGVAKQQTE